MSGSLIHLEYKNAVETREVNECFHNFCEFPAKRSRLFLCELERNQEKAEKMFSKVFPHQDT